MKTAVVTQPSDTGMGEVLVSLLTSQSPVFDKIWMVSAFANHRAVRRLAPYVLEAKSRGADIRIVVGIDVQSTSAEALGEIHALGVGAQVVHNARPGHTFHPKIYLFEATGMKAGLFIGSSNLAEGGLYTNYEVSTRTTFDLPDDDAEYATIKYLS